MPNQQTTARHQVGAQPKPNSQQPQPARNDQTRQQSNQTINFAGQGSTNFTQKSSSKVNEAQPQPQQNQATINSQVNTQQAPVSQTRQYTQPNQDQQQAQASNQTQQQTQKTNQNQVNNQAQSQSQNQANNQSQTQQQDHADEANYYAQYQPEESKVAPGMYKPLPEETLLEWQGPSRPFKKRNKKYHSTIVLIAVLISLILGFAGQLIAVTVVIAVAFLAYALSVVPPQDVTYKITTYGIRIENNLYYWQELGRFWFDEKFKQKLLQIETIRFPGRVTVLLADQNQEIINLVLSEVLLNEKPELTLYEKAAAWLQEKIPLDVDDNDKQKEKTSKKQAGATHGQKEEVDKKQADTAHSQKKQQPIANRASNSATNA